MQAVHLLMRNAELANVVAHPHPPQHQLLQYDGQRLRSWYLAIIQSSNRRLSLLYR